MAERTCVQIWRATHQLKFLDPRKPSKNPGHSAFNRQRPSVPIHVFKEKFKDWKPQNQLPLLRTRI